MSWQASSWALKQRVGDPVLKILLLAAANYADPNGRCWPSVDVLAIDSEVSRRTIQRKLAELQERGLIRVSEQFDQRGRQTTSLIELQMGEGDILTPPGRVTPECHGEGDNKVSPPESLNNQSNNQKKRVRSAKQEIPYSDDFEAIWQQYPRTKNTSKKDAWNIYRMLNDERQAQVRAAVPMFAADMRAEGRPQEKIKHMTTWLNGRCYETASPSAPVTKTPPADAYKAIPREQWEKLLLIYSGDENWRQGWGPAPGKPGCCAPPDLIEKLPWHLKPKAA